jgi:hypothetical protein
LWNDATSSPVMLNGVKHLTIYHNTWFHNGEMLRPSSRLQSLKVLVVMGG